MRSRFFDREGDPNAAARGLRPGGLVGLRVGGVTAGGIALRRGEPRCITLTLLLVLTTAIAPNRVAASDFWDNVRTPGLTAYRLHLRQSAAAFALNRADVALQEADVAIQKCADCAAAHVMRGRALLASGRNGDALSAFERALSLDPNALTEAAVARAAAHAAINVGKPEFGVTLLRRLLERRDVPQRDPLALVMLADAIQAQGPATLRIAIVAYREAIENDAAEAQAVPGLALALHRSGDVAQGLALLRRVGTQAAPGTAGGWLPGPERAARTGLWMSAIDDLAGARDAWLRAADGGGPWCDHARATLAAMQTTASAR